MPGARAAAKVARRVAKKIAAYIQNSTARELSRDPKSPYRLVHGDKRFALSTNDAIRAQKSGLPYRPSAMRRKHLREATRPETNPRSAGSIAARRGLSRRPAKPTERQSRIKEKTAGGASRSALAHMRKSGKKITKEDIDAARQIGRVERGGRP